MESKALNLTTKAPSFVVTTDGGDSARKTPPQLMLSTLYGLSKTFSKKVFIGLEIGPDGLGEISVRLTGNDFVGVKFSRQGWANFESSFDLMRKFFATSRENTEMLDQRIMSSGFSDRFTISHHDKAVEIEELYTEKISFLNLMLTFWPTHSLDWTISNSCNNNLKRRTFQSWASLKLMLFITK